MCGIAGIIGQLFEKREKLHIMNEVLVHRGPDGSGIFISENGDVGFAHRRLSIIDLSSLGAQPMRMMDRYTITFNGEIYNYLELIRKFNLILKSNTDTEVILALYHLHRERCLEYFDGMFAFAIHDQYENSTFIARDRFGEKPLYYTQSNGCFYFASEMKAFWSIGIDKKPNKNKYADYLINNAIDSENTLNQTFYESVFSLPPATYAHVVNNEIHGITKYWSIDLSKVNNTINFTEAKVEFKRLLDKSIKLRMRSDVPLGSSLSGGIDSSVIVTQINKNLTFGQLQKTFSARFRDFDKDEGYFINLVLSGLDRTEGFETFPDADSFKNDFDKLVYHQEEPFRTASQYNQFEVMKLAYQNEVVVLLDGQGADEFLGGYLEYYFHYLTKLIYTHPIKGCAEIKKYQNVQKGFRDYRLPRKLPLWLIQKFFGKKLIYDSDVRELMLKDCTSLHLPTLLRYGDKNSMAFSREVRLPFLSHELVEFVFTLPLDFLLNSGWTKFVLRESYSDDIPREISRRVDKVGFEPPQEKWMIHFKEEILRAKRDIDLNYFGVTNSTIISDWKLLMLNKFI